MTNPAVYATELVTADPTLAYGQGRCFGMFAALRATYGVKARPFYDGDHVTTEIDGRHYDARGEVPAPPNAYPLGQEPRVVSQLRRHSLRGGWRKP